MDDVGRGGVSEWAGHGCRPLEFLSFLGCCLVMSPTFAFRGKSFQLCDSLLISYKGPHCYS